MSTGLDGLTVEFIRVFWDVVGMDYRVFARAFLTCLGTMLYHMIHPGQSYTVQERSTHGMGCDLLFSEDWPTLPCDEVPCNMSHISDILLVPFWMAQRHYLYGLRLYHAFTYHSDMCYVLVWVFLELECVVIPNTVLTD
eukprot:g40590.t1